MDDKLNFHFITPVWGNEYTKLYINTCLPMLLTDGNLKCREYSPKDRFTIVTTQEDASTIMASEVYSAISQIIKIDLLLADHLLSETNSYQRMSAFYKYAMSQDSVTPSATYFLFLTPDSFWSDGTFKRMMQLAQNGVKVALAPGFRVNLEEAIHKLKPYIKDNQQNEILKPTSLVELIFEHTHNMTTMQIWQDKKTFNNAWPSNLLWMDEENKQIFAHCLHLHPLLVLAPEGNSEIGASIDGDFIDNLGHDLSDYYICEDTYFAAELSSKHKTWGDSKLLSLPSTKQVTKFAILHSNRMHRYFFKHRVSLPNGAPPTEKLNRQIQQTTRKIINSYDNPVIVIAVKLQKFVARAINFLVRTFNHRHTSMS